MNLHSEITVLSGILMATLMITAANTAQRKSTTRFPAISAPHLHLERMCAECKVEDGN